MIRLSFRTGASSFSSLKTRLQEGFLFVFSLLLFNALLPQPKVFQSLSWVLWLSFLFQFKVYSFISTVPPVFVFNLYWVAIYLTQCYQENISLKIPRDSLYRVGLFLGPNIHLSISWGKSDLIFYLPFFINFSSMEKKQREQFQLVYA